MSDPSPDLYPSRGATERLIERQDPVVYAAGSTGTFALGEEQLATYERDGFLVLPGVFSPMEAQVLLEAFQTTAADPQLQGRDELVLEPDSREPRSLFSPETFSPLLQRLSRDARILDKVIQLLGSDVYIHQSRVNIKRAFDGRSFPWHSDFETWHAEDGIRHMRLLSAWIMLTLNNEFNGPLYLVPGSHKVFVACQGETPEDHFRASLRRQEYGVPSREAMARLIRAGGIAGVYGPPGTLVLHDCNIMHGSSDNMTPESRTNLFFVYNSVLNTPAPQPFAAARFRPTFLGRRVFTPLRSMEHQFA
jgi:ectoine hydroxylase